MWNSILLFWCHQHTSGIRAKNILVQKDICVAREKLNRVFPEGHFCVFESEGQRDAEYFALLAQASYRDSESATLFRYAVVLKPYQSFKLLRYRKRAIFSTSMSYVGQLIQP